MFQNLFCSVSVLNNIGTETYKSCLLCKLLNPLSYSPSYYDKLWPATTIYSNLLLIATVL